MKVFYVLLTASSLAILCFSTQVHGQESEWQGELAILTKRALGLYLQKPDSSIECSKKALAVAITYGDRFYEGYSYYVLSKAYWAKANYRLSTEYAFKALKFFENSEHKDLWTASLLSVARTLVELGNYEKAAELIQQAYKIGEGVGDDRMMAEADRERSFLFTEQGELDSALYFADKGIRFYREAGDSLNASILYSRKSRVYFLKKDFKRSREYAFKGLHIDTLVGNRRALGISYFHAAQNELALSNITEATRLLRNSIRINREIGNLAWLVRSHELLAKVHLTNNNPELAAVQMILSSEYKDSLYNAEKSGQIQEMQSLYELESKENTIKMLGQENALRQQEVRNQRLFVVILLTGMLLLTLLLFFLTRLRTIQTRTNRDLTLKNSAIEQQREELQTQAEKLQQLNRLQTKLFSVISHDLRGPVNNLQALLDLFTKQMLTPEELLSVSDKLRANLNFTQRTLENLLNWALSQMNGIKTEMKDVDLQNCIEEATHLMHEVAGRKKITIRQDIEQGLVIRADPDQLQLVLRNLIHNSIKFSKIGDPIMISAARKNDRCQLIIEDCGIGMSVDEMDTIEEAKHFTKVGTQQEKGTGLGLLLCKEFIERNGGTLQIQSTLGTGTKISFTLLLAEQSPALVAIR
jgi:two-component system, sensor histidine kinase and response regulator